MGQAVIRPSRCCFQSAVPWSRPAQYSMSSAAMFCLRYCVKSPLATVVCWNSMAMSTRIGTRGGAGGGLRWLASMQFGTVRSQRARISASMELLSSGTGGLYCCCVLAAGLQVETAQSANLSAASVAIDASGQSMCTVRPCPLMCWSRLDKQRSPPGRTKQPQHACRFPNLWKWYEE